MINTYSYFTVRLIFLLVMQLVTKCESRRQFEEIIQNAQKYVQTMFPNEVSPPKDDVAVIEAERKFENEVVPYLNEAILQELIQKTLKDFQENNVNELHLLKDSVPVNEDTRNVTLSLRELIEKLIKYLKEKGIFPPGPWLWEKILDYLLKYIKKRIIDFLQKTLHITCDMTGQRKKINGIATLATIIVKCERTF